MKKCQETNAQKRRNQKTTWVITRVLFFKLYSFDFTSIIIQRSNRKKKRKTRKRKTTTCSLYRPRMRLKNVKNWRLLSVCRKYWQMKILRESTRLKCAKKWLRRNGNESNLIRKSKFVMLRWLDWKYRQAIYITLRSQGIRQFGRYREYLQE